MNTYHPTPEAVERDADTLQAILSMALRRLNELGYPRVNLPTSDRRCPDPAVTQPDTMQRVDHETSTQHT